MLSQEDSVEVGEEIKRLVYDIIAENNIKRTCKIKYYPGSQQKDGYTTNRYAVDITDDEASLNLFLKCAFDMEDKIPGGNYIYICEMYFYKTIYPTYTAFLKNKGIKDGFCNVPACYGFDETRGKEIIAFENLRKKGYTMFDKFMFMNDELLKLTLKSFAKFHAISFALKDQQKDLHDEFCEHCPNVLIQEDFLPKIYSGFAKDFVALLDPVEDKDILDKCDNLEFKVYDQVKNMDGPLTDYSILTKFDCWVNNMMILYENDDRQHPIDVMLLDWQCVARGSPVRDIQGLFYMVASKETLDKHKYYMNIYYDELSERIKELGSDPDILYPYSIFEKEWIDYGVYALGIALGGIRAMLLEDESAPSIEKITDANEIFTMFSGIPHDKEERMIRSKRLIRHMVDIGVL